ncbi:hypothetical protein PV10_02618 [Exophiala mesophila]|uniref:Uncharacterized protein n=1 Tax=Exophiala mesophila TaxID=212818 RepID=A0A0D1ZJU3_EXOME|nr:uncharacterized protein PV10_02618 [Exophiala mesophila]KIV94897.1 hypothetical protein PV10_02618 [Exophiala mesophila]
MYESLQIPWSTDNPGIAEQTYRQGGFVKTKGTIFLLPPSESILRETFNDPPRPKTRMSAGAVALCKHFERCGSSAEHNQPHPFWKLPTGSNENKTETARQILDDMLARAPWRNVMLLHRGVAVYEIRNRLGYGMRWTLDIVEEDEIGEKRTEMERREMLDGQPDAEDLDKEWRIVKTTFRGFLEPIAAMDHELEQGD